MKNKTKIKIPSFLPDKYFNLPYIELYYDLYLISYEFVEQYKKLGPGTIITYDVEFNLNYKEFQANLTRDLKPFLSKQELEDFKFERIRTGQNQVFIPGYFIEFNK